MSFISRPQERVTLRPMALSDVPVDNINLAPLDSLLRERIALSEERIASLSSGLRALRLCEDVSADRYTTSGENPPTMRQLSAVDDKTSTAATSGPPRLPTPWLRFIAPLPPAPVEGDAPALSDRSILVDKPRIRFTATHTDETMLVIRAMTGLRHSRNLRVQEEIACNLGINVADVAEMERSCREMLAPSLVPLPSIALLVLFLYTCDASALAKVASGSANPSTRAQRVIPPPRSTSASDQRRPKPNGETAVDPYESLRAKFEKMISDAREQSAARSVVTSFEQTSATLFEAVAAVNTPDLEPVAAWAGCVGLFLASVARLTGSTNNIVLDLLRQIELTPISTAEQPASTCASPVATTSKMFLHSLRFASGEAAFNAFSRMAVALEANPLVMTPVGWTLRQVTARQLRALIGRGGKNDNMANADTVTDTKLLAGVPMSERLAKFAGNRDRSKNLNVNILVVTMEPEGSGWTSLSTFSTRRNENEAALEPMATIKFTGFSVEENRLTFALAPRTGLIAAAGASARTFFEEILSDAQRASDTAASMHARLVSQFPRPQRCPRHPTLPFTAFCTECDVFICSTCTKEKHARHTMVPRATFAGDERQRLSMKRQQLMKRVNRLRELKQNFERDEATMHRLVDNALDEIKTGLQRRQIELHADVDDRSSHLTERFRQEAVLCEKNRTIADHVTKVAQMFRKGWPISGLPNGTGLVDANPIYRTMSQRLPTKAVLQMLEVLTWSNPSQYLTTNVYPPT